jgi:hypothetical protein
MSGYDPQAKLCALRSQVEKWLLRHGEYTDSDRTLVANNLTLWASSFISVTDDEATAIANEYRGEGAGDFIAAVRELICLRIAEDRNLDPVAVTAQAFSEVADYVLYG